MVSREERNSSSGVSGYSDTLGHLFIHFLSSGTRIHQRLGFKLVVVTSEKMTCIG